MKNAVTIYSSFSWNICTYMHSIWNYPSDIGRIILLNIGKTSITVPCLKKKKKKLYQLEDNIENGQKDLGTKSKTTKFAQL